MFHQVYLFFPGDSADRRVHVSACVLFFVFFSTVNVGPIIGAPSKRNFFGSITFFVVKTSEHPEYEDG